MTERVFMKLRSYLPRLSALALAAGAALPSFATGTAVDVTAVTASIAEQAAPVAAIGAAVLLLFVGIKAFKWVRRALS
jgi:hypothetical protein